MSDGKQDKKPAKSADPDRDESTGLMEPMLVSESSGRRTQLADLTVELAAKSAAFRHSLPGGVLISLARLVRLMNCYYSNLIEGHDTHPVDIERALKHDYSADPEKRDLQQEAIAHIAVQKWIDEGGLNGRATTQDGIIEVHRRFCELLPAELLWVENPDTKERIEVVPGKLRDRDVAVGRHVPVSPGALPRFLTRFEEAYAKLGKTDAIIASACAHHRLLWIHPFLDGNGRVARLMSYAMQRDTLDTGGIWSIARGLARNEAAYKQHLTACDMQRRNDLDGRGTLSEEALAEFSIFFLQTCIDQVTFMQALVQPDQLRNRILIWAEEEARADRLPQKSGAVLEAILFRGELPRGDVTALLQTSERSARRVTSALLEAEILTSESPRAPLHLAFPARFASRWMPGLFPG
ncbi:Fic family protein [Bradyrhizobium sp. USDA 4532]|uniref:Fic family protein n=1 Tax=unclassified Bradyrhizobium TaxID=2631580 RepID=UPI00209EBCF7|nr:MULTISPECIES: Fic family protein [unclassified Bradyrhizobium]MCP1835704.1 Fic family protein [Bradyrhizobium sp. USDA 4545]MCP1920453.1 Fic family protein [Bradyrhizobium sp. USDA 4532]